MENVDIKVVQPQLADLNPVEAVPALNLGVVLVTILFASVLSAIMYYSFRKSRPAISYDQKFNVTLVMISLIITLMLQLVQSNVALSVGIMGSLSIVRFRTNAKDPRDLGFVFWAMGIGLASATANWSIGILGSILMSAFVIFSSQTRTDADAMLVIIRGSKANVPLISDTVHRSINTARLKAQNLLEGSFEVVYEIKAESDVQQTLLKEIMTIEGVDSVNMLAPSAEVT